MTVHTAGRYGNYPTGGYIAMFPNNMADALDLIATLKDITWIKTPTRAVFLEFSLYNPNANLFVVFKLIFEYPLSGGVSVMHRIVVASFIQFSTKEDFLCLGAFFLFLICVILLTVTVALRPLPFTEKGKQYYYSSWTPMDIIVLIACYTFIILSLWHILEAKKVIDDIVNDIKESKVFYAQLDGVVASYKVMTKSVFVLTIVLLFKVLQILYIFSIFKKICGAFVNGALQLLAAVVFMTVMLWIFAVISAILFGAHTPLYGSVFFAAQKCLLILFGEFNVEEAKYVTDLESGIPFYITYMLIVGCLCRAIIFAVICYYYTESRNPSLDRRKSLKIFDICFNLLYSILAKININKAYRLMHYRLVKKNSDYMIVRELMVRNHFSKKEIYTFMRQKDITPTSKLDDEKLQEIFHEIDEIYAKKTMFARNFHNMKRIELLRKQLYILNSHLQYVLEKIIQYMHYRVLLNKKKEIDNLKREQYRKDYKEKQKTELKEKKRLHRSQKEWSDFEKQ